MDNKRVSLISLLALTLALLATQPPDGSLSVEAQANEKQAGSDQATEGFNQEQALAELRKQIAGKENLPAEQVFKNIQILKGMPAGRLLAVMNIGYSKSLGVNCTHCHVAGQWEKEDRPTKQVAREMSEMGKVINNDLLKKIKNLKSATPIVNCTTCHRGQVKPALNMP